MPICQFVCEKRGFYFFYITFDFWDRGLMFVRLVALKNFDYIALKQLNIHIRMSTKKLQYSCSHFFFCTLQRFILKCLFRFPTLENCVWHISHLIIFCSSSLLPNVLFIRKSSLLESSTSVECDSLVSTFVS